MPKTDEKLAAILAKYRKDIAGGQFFTPTQEYILRLLDRIEAAYKREHADWHAETNAAKEERNRIACKMRYEFAAKCRACKAEPGNAAAMREALEYVIQFDATDEAAEEDGLTDAERIAEYADHIEECQKKARAALAAPERNCDRFATANDAVEGYIAAHPHDDEPDASTYGSWLFATAEGKEPDNG